MKGTMRIVGEKMAKTADDLEDPGKLAQDGVIPSMLKIFIFVFLQCLNWW